tara:strand:- start:43 stop:324 length:282 start_codon:yes stop_codon:yes gene_type:complete
MLTNNMNILSKNALSDIEKYNELREQEEKNTMKKMSNLNLSIVRNVAYNKIEKMKSTIKEVIEVDETLLNMIDINMKNAINKIINDYKAKEIK